MSILNIKPKEACKYDDPEKAVNYGAAHGALAMTTPGDTSMANLKEVESIMKGVGARVIR